ncbi:hypothetical protein LIER_13666 [Lithospermum erythrorhizon]|uniref:Uncharacterized protein n=1 Tax=Lithospermum erythrorhizon TaxID=34254 RepID=A0AAV3PW83_LITER
MLHLIIAGHSTQRCYKLHANPHANNTSGNNRHRGSGHSQRAPFVLGESLNVLYVLHALSLKNADELMCKDGTPVDTSGSLLTGRFHNFLASSTDSVVDSVNKGKAVSVADSLLWHLFTFSLCLLCLFSKMVLYVKSVRRLNNAGIHSLLASLTLWLLLT